MEVDNFPPRIYKVDNFVICFVVNSLRYLCTKNYRNGTWFDKVNESIQRVQFFLPHNVEKKLADILLDTYNGRLRDPLFSRTAGARTTDIEYHLSLITSTHSWPYRPTQRNRLTFRPITDVVNDTCERKKPSPSWKSIPIHSATLCNLQAAADQ